MKAFLCIFIGIGIYSYGYANAERESIVPKLKHIKVSEKLEKLPRLIRTFLPEIFPELKALSVDGELQTDVEQVNSPLMSAITAYLKENYERIGEGQSMPILHHSEEFDWGEKNTTGLQWQLPMGAFQIGVNRQLIPDFRVPKRYAVVDQFVLQIDAQTFLRQLRDSELIELDQASFGAYAGIVFRREYSSTHFEEGFAKALTSNLESLFFPFFSFRSQKLKQMDLFEQVQKSDSIVAHAGGFFRGPLWQGVSLRTGILGQIDLKKSITIQNRGEEGHFVMVDKTKQKKVGFEAELEAEFFELLRLTVFSLKMTLEHREKRSLTLQVPQSVLYSCGSRNHFKNLVRKGELSEVWRKYVIQEDLSLTRGSSADWKFLVFGGTKASETEHIRFQQGDEYRDLYRSHWESFKLNFGLGELLKNSFLLKMFNLDDQLDARAIESQMVRLEFAHDGDRPLKLSEMHQASDKPLAVVIQEKLEIPKLKGFGRANLRRRAADFLRQKTNLVHSTAKLIRDKEMRGPMALLTQIVLNNSHIKRMLEKPLSDVMINFASVCQTPNVMKWATSPREEVYRVQSAEDICVKRIGRRYLRLRDEYQQSSLIGLKNLRNFFQIYVKNVHSYHVFHHLIGQKSFFHYGELSAEWSNGIPLRQSFQTGPYNGLGLSAKDLF